MKLRSILAAFAVMACGSVFAQNATKAELDALAQRVSKLEMDLERVITENVNLVEQLNVKTVTSVTDKNGLQWDIVKVEPNESTNEVKISLRLINTSGVKKRIYIDGLSSYAIDSNSNLSNNKYKFGVFGSIELDHNAPLNAALTLKNVPVTCAYLSLINLKVEDNTGSSFKYNVKFSGVHIPW